MLIERRRKKEGRTKKNKEQRRTKKGRTKKNKEGKKEEGSWRSVYEDAIRLSVNGEYIHFSVYEYILSIWVAPHTKYNIQRWPPHLQAPRMTNIGYIFFLLPSSVSLTCRCIGIRPRSSPISRTHRAMFCLRVSRRSSRDDQHSW